MAIQTVFKRHEVKFIITEEQCRALMLLFGDRMKGDEYGKSIIRNIYFDTPSHLLIRNSLDKPLYKEKMRLRGYGNIKEDSHVFLEVKKKFKGVVYKRRLRLTEKEAMDYMLRGAKLPDSQIAREIDYFVSYYENLRPSVVLSYEREAFYSVDDETFRITFDRNVLFRDEDFSLTSPVYGKALLKENEVLMEIKTSYSIPIWLTSFLSREKIYKVSFSKYGTAYAEMLLMEKENNNV